MRPIVKTLTGLLLRSLTDDAPANLWVDERGRLHVTSSGGDRALTDAGVWAFADPVTPSNTVDIPNGPARGLYVAVAGDVKFEFLTSDGVTKSTLTMTFAAKDVIPFAVTRVYATGTTATVVAGF